MPSIHPQYLTFGNLVTKRLLRIPDYQRAYSWGREQRQDLGLRPAIVKRETMLLDWAKSEWSG